MDVSQLTDSIFRLGDDVFQGDNRVDAPAVVLCMLDIRTGETITSGEWENRGVVPLIARAAVLPPKVGNSIMRVPQAEL